MSPVAQRKDPYLSRNFFLEIDGINQAAFVSCTGLGIKTEVIEYQEGGLNDFAHKLPGRSTFKNITLRIGMTDSKELWEWYKATLQGLVKRKNLSIVLYNQAQTEVRRWNLREAFPIKWDGPDFDAAHSNVAIESLEIAYHGFEVQ